MADEPTHYEKARSRNDNHLFVLCYADRFYEDVPPDVIRRGPWRSSRGLVSALRPDVRLALARAKYLVHETEDAIWTPEA